MYQELNRNSKLNKYGMREFSRTHAMYKNPKLNLHNKVSLTSL